MQTLKRERSTGEAASFRAASPNRPEVVQRELVRRIVSSPTFARSVRLSSLLTHLCDMTLQGRDGELSEQTIGRAVFGRSQDYDSSVDGIVRTQASRLRQRLDLYYEQEGAEESIRLMIPKGGYVPVFAPRRAAEDPHSPAPPEMLRPLIGPALPPEKPAPSLAQRMTSRLPWTLCGVLALALIVLLSLNLHRSPGIPPARHPLWSQMFQPGHPTLVIPADSGLVLSHAIDLRTVPLSEYIVGDYRSPNGTPPDPAMPAQMRALRTDFNGRRYTSIVDLEAAVKLAETAQAAQSSLQVRYARDVRPNDLKDGNIILIGAAEANPWEELFEPNMNFVLKNDYKARVFSVFNRSPLPGELARYDSVNDDPQHQVFGVVAFVPNLSGDGNALIIEGTSMAGTEAAWDFLADDSELLPFLRKIELRGGRIPHFELLLGTQNMGASAVHGNLLAWRVHK
ncbi:hypothetical protein SAMN05421819_0970 [Bryocella elongata]|uniref:Adenylate cyclase n=1 Tax=Bryocella elongata TaxID=863522 RepID=A0A1H5UCY1_9BACT|nr:hypothetical protein [Bryocella elongata]SEF72910.1 hypothetical protein SAMN05421819_0970 [Bryocella elongata]